MIAIVPAEQGYDIKIEGTCTSVAKEFMMICREFLREKIFCDIELFAMLQAACDVVEERRK